MRFDLEKDGCFLLKLIILSSNKELRITGETNIRQPVLSSAFENVKNFDSDQLLFLVSSQCRFVDNPVST